LSSCQRPVSQPWSSCLGSLLDQSYCKFCLFLGIILGLSCYPNYLLMDCCSFYYNLGYSLYCHPFNCTACCCSRPYCYRLRTCYSHPYYFVGDLGSPIGSGSNCFAFACLQRYQYSVGITTAVAVTRSGPFEDSSLDLLHSIKAEHYLGNRTAATVGCTLLSDCCSNCCTTDCFARRIVALAASVSCYSDQ